MSTAVPNIIVSTYLSLFIIARQLENTAEISLHTAPGTRPLSQAQHICLFFTVFSFKYSIAASTIEKMVSHFEEGR